MSKDAIIVTGAAGFIGSHLVDRLLAAGNFVIGIDDLSLGREANLDNARQSPTFCFARADINNYQHFEENVRTLLGSRRLQAIWHMAANSDIGAGARDPSIDLQRTFLTTFQSLRLARELGASDFLLASTSAVYGELPGPVSEHAGPLFPISSYGAMKLASEAALSATLETHLQRAWIFRFPNVVGSRATHGAIYDFVHKLRRTPDRLEVLGNGQQEKPYLHVSELIDAMLFLHQEARERMNCFNIAPSNSVTKVSYIAESVVRRVSPAARIDYTGGNKGWPGDVPRFSYDTSRLNALGWRPRCSSNEAVERAVDEISREIAA